MLGVHLSVYLLDELFVVAAAVFTIPATKLQERHGRLLKRGVLTVFGLAVIASLGLAAAERAVRHSERV